MSAEQQYKFSDIIADPVIRERWEKVRRYFFLRESTYDMSNRCNIRCEGCYYFVGEKQFAAENNSETDWRQLLESEKQRGITFVVLAGAEPSLVPQLCKVCYQVIPLGAIATNGLKPIPRAIDYRIHISVWGNDQTSLNIRKAPDMLVRQMANYKDDPRAVFVYTFTPYNIDEVREVTGCSPKMVSKSLLICFPLLSAITVLSSYQRITAENTGGYERAAFGISANRSFFTL